MPNYYNKPIKSKNAIQYQDNNQTIVISYKKEEVEEVKEQPKDEVKKADPYDLFNKLHIEKEIKSSFATPSEPLTSDVLTVEEPQPVKYVSPFQIVKNNSKSIII